MNLYSTCESLRKHAYPFQLFYLWNEIKTRFLNNLRIIVIYSSNFTDLRTVKGKGKSVLLETLSGPKGSRKLRFPDF